MGNSNDLLIDAMLEPKAAAKIKALMARQAKDAASAAARASTGGGNDAAGQILALAFQLQNVETEAERTEKVNALKKISQRADVPQHLKEQAAALANSGGESLAVVTRAEAEAKILVDGVLRNMGHDVA